MYGPTDYLVPILGLRIHIYIYIYIYVYVNLRFHASWVVVMVMGHVSSSRDIC